MSNTAIELEKRYSANNYDSLPVVLARGRGVYVWDEQGRRYLDMMSAYSAVSHGHSHPRLVAALEHQARELAIVSRAFYHYKLGPFLKRACEITGQERALPMNTGTEAVETALKAARKWARVVKGVGKDKPEIIACHNNFHGRSITIVGLSSEPQYRRGFGPFPPGLILIPFGDAEALEKAITPNTAAFLVEPIQGEGGVVLPPRGYLKRCLEICRDHNVLLICDEVQTGLGRTGRMLACQHERIKPDGVILGKALSGGLLPVSLFLARKEVMDVFTPGDHGSTFGGNVLAAAVGLEAIETLIDEELCERSRLMGGYLLAQLRRIHHPAIREVRGQGLFIGMELDPAVVTARAVCERLLEHGILTKDTHETVLRFTPPLIISKTQIEWAVQRVAQTLQELVPLRRTATR